MDEIKNKLDKIIGLLEQIANPPVVTPTVWVTDQGGTITYQGCHTITQDKQ